MPSETVAELRERYRAELAENDRQADRLVNAAVTASAIARNRGYKIHAVAGVGSPGNILVVFRGNLPLRVIRDVQEVLRDLFPEPLLKVTVCTGGWGDCLPEYIVCGDVELGAALVLCECGDYR